jgi:hypothetical protein
MTGSMAIVLGVSLVIVLLIAVFILLRRQRRLSTPKARYLRDMREIQLRTYLESKPRPAPQSGADGLEKKYYGYNGPGV